MIYFALGLWIGSVIVCIFTGALSIWIVDLIIAIIVIREYFIEEIG